MPSDVDLNNFLVKKCKLRLENVTKACPMRNRQEFWVSFEHEEDANSFERPLLAGIDWGNGMMVTGHRMDVPSLQVKVRGAANDVDEKTIRNVLGPYGEVKSCRRGTARRSSKAMGQAML